DQRIASREDLEQTLQEVVALCRERGIGLIFVTEPTTDSAMRHVVETVAEQHSVPFTGNVLTRTGKARIDDLVQAIRALR
ncbi:MAG: zinc ABC transporter substrate-binding protein, partial [bacterium]|nr:zinc ABC transporter substrate-binding protein [bacterium]